MFSEEIRCFYHNTGSESVRREGGHDVCYEAIMRYMLSIICICMNDRYNRIKALSEQLTLEHSQLLHVFVQCGSLFLFPRINGCLLDLNVLSVFLSHVLFICLQQLNISKCSLLKKISCCLPPHLLSLYTLSDPLLFFLLREKSLSSRHSTINN